MANPLVILYLFCKNLGFSKHIKMIEPIFWGKDGVGKAGSFGFSGKNFY